MKKYFIIGLMLMSFSNLALFAQEDEVAEKKGNVPSEGIQNIQLAQQLANYGYANSDALSLVKAAQIVVAAPPVELEPEKVEEGKVKEEAKEATTVANLLEVDKLLADAEGLAADDEAVLALIKVVKETPQSRGAAGGEKYGVHRVSGNDYDVFYVKFWGNEYAEVMLLGDGDTDLDLYVYDESGNLVGKDIDNSDACYVSWYADKTQEYKIKVKNLGSVYNEYEIATN